MSIVVIPSVDSDREFSEGMAEAVSTELARNPELRVVAWPLVAEYRRKNGVTADSALGKTASDLGAQAVLYVAVRLSGDQRRISALLMRPELGWKQWAGEYQRPVSEPFTVQREVARAIAEEVRTGIEKARAK
jgi:TolB-like protein